MKFIIIIIKNIHELELATFIFGWKTHAIAIRLENMSNMITLKYCRPLCYIKPWYKIFKIFYIT